jgi:hypothetical protein
MDSRLREHHGMGPDPLVQSRLSLLLAFLERA